MSSAGSSSALIAEGLANFEVTSSGSLSMYNSTIFNSSSSSLAKIHASPESSNFGLPARPSICLISITGRGIDPPPTELHLRWSRMITLLAGKFTPCASVGVATIASKIP